MNESAINHKLGPLKVWQWGALAGGALFVYYLWSHKKTTTSEAVQPSESFATGNPVGQNVEGGGGGGGSSTPTSGVASEQPAPAPPAPAASAESPTAPGLGAGQLYATEVGEVLSGAMALREAGLIPPAEGANHSRMTEPAKKAHEKSKKKSEARKKPTHAKQGQHHHEQQRHKHGRKPSPHHGATHSARAHARSNTHHHSHHAASHHTRKR